jgi:hypothetical protein
LGIGAPGVAHLRQRGQILGTGDANSGVTRESVSQLRQTSRGTPCGRQRDGLQRVQTRVRIDLTRARGV